MVHGKEVKREMNRPMGLLGSWGLSGLLGWKSVHGAWLTKGMLTLHRLPWALFPVILRYPVDPV
jgi:hypothetical protein